MSKKAGTVNTGIMDSTIDKVSFDIEKLRKDAKEAIAQVERGEVVDIDEAFKADRKLIEKLSSCSPST